MICSQSFFSRRGVRAAGLFGLFFIAFLAKAAAQSTLFEAQKVESPSLDAKLRDQFSAFSVWKMDSKSLAEFAQKSALFHLDLKFGDEAFFQTQLFPFDLRDPDFKFLVATTEGVEEFPAPPNVTYRGSLFDGSAVRATFAEGYLALLIDAADGREFYLEPAFRFDSSLLPASDLYVLYEKATILPKTLGCMALEIEGRKRHELQKIESNDRGLLPPSGCTVMRMCLAADASMFTKYTTTALTLAHMTTVMNGVGLDYASVFDRAISFNVVASLVSTSAAAAPESCWSPSTSANTFLTAFTDWGRNTLVAPCATPFGGVTFDDASLWTNRDFDGATVGLAWVGGICYNYGFNVLQDYTANAGELRNMTSHEIGHNFSCNHVASATIMNGFVNVGGSTVWDAINVAELNAHEGTALACLTGATALQGSSVPYIYDLVATWCTNSPLPPFTSNFRSPTSIAWTMAGGSPSSASTGTTSTGYSTSGTKTVAVSVVSNFASCPGTYSSSKTVNILAVNGPVSPVACTINPTNLATGATDYDTGILNVSVPGTGLSATTFDSYDDEVVYLNRSCVSFGTFVSLANTISIEVGTLNAQRLRAWIDYNNDGVFTDATERIVNQTTGVTGVQTFSFTVPSFVVAGTLTGRVLRLRVASDLGTPTACATPSYGQIEDYGMIVPAALLPVELIDFTAKKAQKAIQLDWQTASETNSDRFEIERSADGLRFSAIGRMAAAGSSADVRDYRFFDPVPFFGTNFYRLREVDLDGSSRFGIVREVDFGGARPEPQAFPNPIDGGSLSVRFFSETENAEAVLEIFDQTGRLLRIEKAEAEKGWNQLEPSVVDLPSGFLTVLLRFGGRVEAMRVRKI